jgi:hypothetical protein
MARRATKLDEDANFGSPARNRAREQASMGRNPSEQKKIIAAQSPSSALNPDRQGGDSDPHHITIPDHFRRSGYTINPIVKRAVTVRERTPEPLISRPTDCVFRGAVFGLFHQRL